MEKGKKNWGFPEGDRNCPPQSDSITPSRGASGRKPKQLEAKCSFCLLNKLVCTIFCIPRPDWKVSVRSSDSCQLKVKLFILSDAPPRQRACLPPLPVCLCSK